MNNELNPKFLKQICGNAETEFCLYNPRSKSGIQTWEIKARNTDNTRKIIVVRDYGYKIDHEEIQRQFVQHQPAFNFTYRKR